MRLSLLITALSLLFTVDLAAQNALRLTGPSSWPDQTEPLLIEVRVDNDVELETFQLAIAHDSTQISIDSFTFELTADPDTPSNPFIEIVEGPSGVLAQIVLETPLAPGTDTLLATLAYRPTAPMSVDDAVTIQFEDNALGDPPVSNRVGLAIGGFITAADGLLFENYLAGILAFSIEPGDIPVGGVGSAYALLATEAPVEAYQLSIAHSEAELVLEDIDLIGTVSEVVGAEFFIPVIYPDGGTASVVLDLEAPFDGQSIPTGSQQRIARYSYSCVDHPLGTPAVDHALTFVDGVFGSIPVFNIVVTNQGATLFPEKTDGSIRCLTEPLATDVQFHVGTLQGSTVVPAVGLPGSTIPVDLFYSEPNHEIDAFSIALAIDCALEVTPLDIAGTELDALGVEFAVIDLDDVDVDGDGCELTVQLVLDALPPFDGQRAPASATPLRLGTMMATIPSVVLGTTFALDFTDGLNGALGVPVDNGVRIYELDYPVTLNSSFVQAGVPQTEPAFVRSDCNNDGSTEISDAVFLLTELFQPAAAMGIDCQASCDTNGDGDVDIADAVYALSYLFTSGTAPPAPFPGCGEVPGADCASFSSCP
ncbi:MAG: hypothetical protein KDC38_17730 [Planctomycetes bacterium]|nr:hypothetical protein [Planctomycetota bacterium]